MNYNNVYNIIDKDKDFLIKLTKNLVQTPSVNPKLEKGSCLFKIPCIDIIDYLKVII